MYKGDKNIAVVNSGNVKLAASDATPYLDSLVAAVFIGVIGGLLGALFIIMNNKVNYIRKKVLKEKWMKVVEACFLVVLTVSVFFLCANLSNNCMKEDENDFMVIKKIEVKQFSCEHGYYNRIGTLLFDS